jgi:DNA polymerase V
MGERTYYELKGLVCYPLSEAIDENQKSLMVSRSFGDEVKDIESLKDSLVHYANNAGAKLRKRGLWAHTIGVYIRSSPFKEGYYSNFTSIALNQPTQDTRRLIECAHEALEIIYKPGVGYKKSGLMLGDLTNSGDLQQFDLLAIQNPTPGQGTKRSPQAVLKAMDALNQKYGRYTVTVGSMPRKTSKWQGSRDHTSPRYTTRWTDILKV